MPDYALGVILNGPTPVELQREGGIAVLQIDHPPINSLNRQIRTLLLQRFDSLAKDPSIEALVITAKGRVFSGGVDIREFADPQLWTQAFLAELCDSLERFPKLVVVAMNGSAVGGGLELALAADYRIVSANAVLGLPEIRLGLIPGAGGTQRLPRRADTKIALEMILSGQLVPAIQALSWGVVDRVVETDADFHSASILYARELLETSAPKQRCPSLPAPQLSAEILAAARKRPGISQYGSIAPPRAMSAVEAAVTLPLSQGLQLEQRYFAECIAMSEHAALRHVFFAERAAKKVPGVAADIAARPIARIGVVGSGTMGTGIALACLAAEFEVTLVEVNSEALARGLDRIRSSLLASVDRHRLTTAQADRQNALLRGALDYRDLAQVDLVIEAVFEDYVLKETVFRQLDAVCRPGCILATNTSTLDVNRIAAATTRKDEVVGLHFFSPANIMRLLEIVRGTHTHVAVLKTIIDLAARLGKIPVVVGVGFGFVGNRMMEPYAREAQRLVLEGASPAQIDGTLTRFGMAMGPLSVLDLAGIDVTYRIRESRRAAIAHDPSYARMGDELYALGRYGQKTGRGYYRYEGRQQLEDPEIQQIATRVAKELGIVRRSIEDGEILERCLYSLIDEGARVLEEGIAYRASDCDLIYINGYGFPAWRGGPMFHAGAIGLGVVLETLERYRTTLGDYGRMWFRSSELLQRRASQGADF